MGTPAFHDGRNFRIKDFFIPIGVVYGNGKRLGGRKAASALAALSFQ